MATFHAKHGGVWKTTIEPPQCRWGGNWGFGKIWRKLSGAWAEVWPLHSHSNPGGTLKCSSETSTSTSVGVRFNKEGSTSRIGSGGTFYSGSCPAWCTGGDQSVNPGNYYQIRATMVSGTQPSGNFGTWLNMNVNNSWTQLSYSGDRNVGTIKFEIRMKNGSTIIASGNVTLDADSWDGNGGGLPD